MYQIYDIFVACSSTCTYYIFYVSDFDSDIECIKYMTYLLYVQILLLDVLAHIIFSMF